MLTREDRMNARTSARLTPRGQETSISRLERGEHPLAAAPATGASAGTI